MVTRVLVPVIDESGAQISPHFGRAPYFVIIDIDDDGSIISKQITPNTGEHTGGRGHAHDNVFRFNPQVVIVQGMGPRGISSFQDANVAVLRANSLIVDDVVQAYVLGNLEELTEGCVEAHYH